MADRENLEAALNLEFSANRRYEYQIASSPFSRLNAVLEGVRRTEGDHIEALFKRIKRAYEEERPGAGRGFASMLAHLRLDLEFERHAVHTYGRFAREAESPDIKRTFQHLAYSEAGHLKLLEQIIAEIEANRYPVVVYCPICGWELDFGVAPEEGAQITCERCKHPVALAMDEGDFQPVPGKRR